MNLRMYTYSVHLCYSTMHTMKNASMKLECPWMQRGLIDFHPVAHSGGCTCSENLTLIQLDLLPELFDPTSCFHCFCPDIDTLLLCQTFTCLMCIKKKTVRGREAKHIYLWITFCNCKNTDNNTRWRSRRWQIRFVLSVVWKCASTLGQT